MVFICRCFFKLSEEMLIYIYIYTKKKATRYSLVIVKLISDVRFDKAQCFISMLDLPYKVKLSVTVNCNVFSA